MWKELIYDLTPQVQFREPADEDDIARLEEELGVDLPEELTELLLETDGFRYGYGTELVFTVNKILAVNTEFRLDWSFRTLYMPFDSLLFFGMRASGDQFAYPILEGRIRNPDVFMWDHENDSRIWVAPTLRRFLEEELKSKDEDP